MNIFCTIFDRNYLYFGVALYKSLLENSNSKFILYVLAMDRECDDILKKLNYSNLIIINKDEVIVDEYMWIYNVMSYGQVCWSCQPLFCEHIINKFKHNHVIYLEADSYFYDDPQIALEVIESKSVSLVPHRFDKKNEQFTSSGIYCVQFNYFRDNSIGRYYLNLWKASCFLYNKYRSSYYPGQLCMDVWPTLTDEVCVINNIGVGAAPWNISKYDITINNKNLKPLINNKPIIFYHFHEFSFMKNNSFYCSSYKLNKKTKDYIYINYARKLIEIKGEISKLNPDFNYEKQFIPFKTLKGKGLKGFFKNFYLYVLGFNNIIKLK